MRVIMGLGNPGPRYDDTRHNVGWWAVDRLAHDWGAGGFREEGPALRASARVGTRDVMLIKPLTYMNRSGAALAPFLSKKAIDPARDLMVIVDDVTREAGGLRLRPEGSSGGHNGLRSIERIVGREFARLRIGVGTPPPGTDLVDWVLSAPSPAEEEAILTLLPDLAGAMECWIEEGVQEAMNRYNR